MKKFLFGLPLLLSCISLMGQSPQFLVLKDSDTLFCDKVSLIRTGGEVEKIKYTDGSGEHSIDGKVACARLVSFTEGDDVYDMLPLDMEKKVKYRAFQRVTTGKIGMWFYTSKDINLKGKNEVSYLSLSPSTQGESGANYLYATLDGGPMFRVDIGNYKKQIMPLYNGCKKLMDEFGKRFSVFERLTSEMAKYYNENCE